MGEWGYPTPKSKVFVKISDVTCAIHHMNAPTIVAATMAVAKWAILPAHLLHHERLTIGTASCKGCRSITTNVRAIMLSRGGLFRETFNKRSFTFILGSTRFDLPKSRTATSVRGVPSVRPQTNFRIAKKATALNTKII